MCQIRASLLKTFVGLCPLFFFYLFSLPTTLPDFDAGEFTVIAARGGIAHPPGYPLLSIVFQFAALFQGIAGLIPVLSFVSVLCTTAGAILLSLIIYDHTQSYSATALGVYGTFLSATVWRAATAVEPFGLNLLLAGLCLYAFWKIIVPSSDKKVRWFFLSGLSFGLAFCNHHSLAFFLPFAVFVWWFSSGRKFRSFLWFAAGSIMGLLPLLYFFSDVAHGYYIWGNWEAPFQQLIIHLFRIDYGTFSLMASSEGNWYNGIFLFLGLLPKSLSWLFFFGAITGCCFLIRYIRYEGRPKPYVIFYIGLGLSFVLSGFVFAGMMKIGTLSWQKAISERFFALPIVLLSLPIAFSGLRAQRWLEHHSTGLAKGIPLFAVALIGFHGILQWPAAERGAETFYEAHVQNVLRIVENDAVILTHSDSSFFGLLYGRHILNLKPNVALLQVGLWTNKWYQEQFSEKIDYPISEPGELPSVISQLSEKRPVYALDFDDRIKPLLKIAYPVGPLLRVAGASEGVPSPLTLYRLNVHLFESRLILPGMDEKTHFNDWEYSLLGYYRRPWEILGKAFAKDGQQEMADRCTQIEKNFSRE